MFESSKHDYRARIYQRYVSEKTSPDGYSAKDYTRRSREHAWYTRGWLPEDRTAPILEIGCGPGFFLRLMMDHGYTDVTGVDLSEEQVALARHWCPGAKIIHGNLFDVLRANEGRFALIAGFDIIEHFDKREFLELLGVLAAALRQDGRVIFQTPNAESPWGLAMRYHDLTHEIAFDPHSLQHLCRVMGLIQFEARETGPYIHGLLSFGRWVIWRIIHSLLRLWNIAETGWSGSGVYTRVFLASAVKGEHRIGPWMG